MRAIEEGDRVYLTPDSYMHDIIPPAFYKVIAVEQRPGIRYFRVHNRRGRSKRRIAVFLDEIECVIKRRKRN